MAKKKQTKVSTQADPGDEHVETMVMETVVKETPKPKQKKDTWEVKDRNYYLKNNLSPLSYSIKSSSIYYFDEEKGYERELKYTKNQNTPFVDEMKGDQRLDHIIFRNGTLSVPKNKVTLQKLLSLYHPGMNKLYMESKPELNAANDVDWLEMELSAMNLAYEMEPDMAEAVLRTELGSKVTKMSSKELKRDLLLFAKGNPMAFIELASDDNVYLRNLGIRATEAGIIKLSGDNRTFLWGSNDRKLMNVPFEEHPYSALAAWFKTDEGLEIFKSIEKRLN